MASSYRNASPLHKITTVSKLPLASGNAPRLPISTMKSTPVNQPAPSASTPPPPPIQFTDNNFGLTPGQIAQLNADQRARQIATGNSTQPAGKSPPPPRVVIPPPPKKDGTAQTITTIGQAATVAQAGRQLFGEGNQYLSVAQIVALLKILGVKIPKEVSIGLDVAQVAVAGGAVANSVEIGASWGSYCSPVGAAILGVIDILKLTGGVDPNDPNVIAVEMIGNLAVIVGTGGTNVGAWIGLALDEYQLGEGGAAGAFAKGKGDSANRLNSMFRAREAAQYASAMAYFDLYQTGQLDTFDFIDQVAQKSPDLFPKIFPTFAEHLGTLNYDWYASTLKINWWGEVVESGDAHLKFTSSQYNQMILQGEMFRDIVKPVMDPFTNFEQLNPGLMTIEQLALISSVPPFLAYMPPDMDMVQRLKDAYLTPGDLGATFIEDMVRTNSVYVPNQDFEPPVTFNGFTYRDPQTQKQYDNTQMYRSEYDLISKADQSGDMDFLLKIDNVAQKIKQWAYISGEKSNPDPKASVNLWRYPQQYVKALQMLDTMEKSNVMKGFASQYSSYLGNLDDFKAMHKKLTTVSLARAANRKAMSIIASFFGTTPDKIERTTPLTDGSPATFRVKV